MSESPSPSPAPDPAASAPLNFTRQDPQADAEELQRAETYGVLARLWLAPPDADWLAQFKVAVTEAPSSGGHLQAPWEAVVAAMRATTLELATAEYNRLFTGTGKPDIFLYGSYHLSGSVNDKPLVALRTELAELGLARDEASGDTEDHVSFVFEVMRYLIAGDDVAVCHLVRQRQFFAAHVQPWVGPGLCEEVERHPGAKLYAAIATFTRSFMEVEAQAFDIEA